MKLTPTQLSASLAMALSLQTTLAGAETSCASHSWQRLAALPAARQEHGTVTWDNNTLAVIGGIRGTAQGTDYDNISDMHIYDIPSNSWKTGAPSPIALNHPNVVGAHGKVYLLGGLAAEPSTQDWLASAASYMYDPALDKWTPLSPMPPGTQRGSAATAVHGDMIYLIGGMTILRDGYQDSVAMVTAFNTTSGKWVRLPPAAADIPEARQHALAAVVDNALYLVGGRWYGQANVRDSVFRLDLENLDAGWTLVSTMPTARGGLSGAVVGDEIVSFGGEGNKAASTGVFPQTEAFDAASGKWTGLGAMAVPRHGTQAVAVGGRVYVPGGGLHQGAAPTDYFDMYCV